MATKSALQAFLDQAYYWAVTSPAKEGNDAHTKICSLAGIGKKTAWCAGFVLACASKAKIKGKLIGSSKTKDSFAAGICHSVIINGGKWIPGPYAGKKATPKPGDLILYNSKGYHMVYNKNGGVKEWHGYHVGIVYKVTSTQVISMEGNVSGNRAKKQTHSLTSTSIGGYARPNWAKAGVVTTADSTDIGPLYKTENDRHDMTMREIGYMDSKGKLTKSTTDYQIAVINYTTLLGDLFDMFVRYSYGGNTYDLSKLKGNERIVVEYLIDEGFNVAAACGIAGNIKTDSNYNPATFTNNAYYGICKWTGILAGQMRASAGLTSWATNLSGQLDFLMGDLEESHADIIKTLSKVPLTKDGVKTAAVTFASKYRKISSSSTRVTVAQSIFANILVTPPKQGGTASNPQTANKTCTVTDVTKKPQKALSSCWKYFEVGTCDTAMLKEWQSKGKSTNKGLSYMNKCYLIAYNTSYGGIKVEDYVELVTDAGTIPCIVAGAFNDTNTPILFYRDRNDNINLREWATVKIKQIKDYGKRTK